jgi:hypothetical protein
MKFGIWNAEAEASANNDELRESTETESLMRKSELIRK